MELIPLILINLAAPLMMLFLKLLNKKSEEAVLEEYNSTNFVICEKARIKNSRISEAFHICYEYLKNNEANQTTSWLHSSNYKKITQFEEPNYIIYDYNCLSDLGRNNKSMVIPAKIKISLQEDGCDVLIDIEMRRYRFNDYFSLEWYDINKTDLKEARTYWVDAIKIIYESIGVEMSDVLYKILYPWDELSNRERKIELVSNRVRGNFLSTFSIWMDLFILIVVIFDNPNSSGLGILIIGFFFSLICALIEYPYFEIKKEKDHISKLKEKLYSNIA